MTPPPVSELDAAALAGAFASGELTSEAVVAALLDHVAALDGPETSIALRAIAALAPDALEVAAARDAERREGVTRGPLHGVPVLVKDNIEALGLPGTAGSTALVGRPSRDAPLVARLREAGAIVLASTNLSQWANIRSARSTSGWSATGGLVANPWALDRSAGGSSSGSGAALAARYAPLAVGTETDGSIVCPASLNGVVGLKPTVGAVPRAHVVPISASQDSPGPMARTVADVATLYEVLAGVRLAPVTTAPRVVLATTWATDHAGTDGALAAAVAALAESGTPVRRRDVAVPGPSEGADELTVVLIDLVDDLGAYLADRPGTGVRSLLEVVMHEDATSELEQPYFGHDYFLQAIATGGRAGPAYHDARARNLAWAVEVCLEPALADADVLISAAYGPAWKSDLVVGGHPAVASVATMPAAIAGWPIASVPVGLVHGLPVGAAIIGRPGAEAMVLAAAARLETAVARAGLWASPRPSFAAPSRGL